MISYRAFRNADPPVLNRLWNAAPAVTDMVQPLTLLHWDRFVLSKPYFVANGLVVAMRDDQPIGFVHASMDDSQPGEGGQESRRGAISMLHLLADVEEAAIAKVLIEQAQSFLKGQGVLQVQAGGLDPVDPFYFGLYGAGVPGIRLSDLRRVAWFASAGFQESRCYQVRRLDLARFRPPVDRHLMQLRRLYDVALEYDWPVGSIREACTVGILDRVRYRAKHQGHGTIDARSTLIDVNAITGVFSPRMYVLENVDASDAQWDSGLVTFLLVETIRQLQAYGVSSLQLHVDAADHRKIQIVERLGFQVCDHSVVMAKSI